MRSAVSKTICLSALLSTVTIAAPAHYTLTQIIVPATGGESIYDFNNLDQALIFVSASTGYNYYIWKNGVATNITSLHVPKSPLVQAYALNDLGALTGHYQDTKNSNVPGFILSAKGVVTKLTIPSQTASQYMNIQPWSINNNNQVGVHVVDANFRNYDALWSNGQLLTLPPLPNLQFVAHPLYVNDMGIVAGASDGPNGTPLAVEWVNGTLQPLELPATAAQSQTTAINNAGEISGFVADSSGGNPHAVIWLNGAAVQLSMAYPTQSWSYAYGLDAVGDVIGQTGVSATGVATIWDSTGVASDLNTLVVSTDPLKPYVTLTKAVKINDNGKIISWGSDSRALPGSQPTVYLLTPQ